MILLTGATSTIGSAIASKLSEEYNLILHGRNPEKLNDLQHRLHKQHRIWVSDFSSIENLEADFIDYLKNENISISGFIHCAGYVPKIPNKSINLKMIYETYNVNVFSAQIITKVLSTRRINKIQLESIIFISSTSSIRGVRAFSIYGASKSALNGLMRSLALELAPNTRVNCVLPGGIKTHDDSSDKIGINRPPLGEGTPDDIAETVVFLTGKRARWITGQEIVIDGGRIVDITEA